MRLLVGRSGSLRQWAGVGASVAVALAGRNDRGYPLQWQRRLLGQTETESHGQVTRRLLALAGMQGMARAEGAGGKGHSDGLGPRQWLVFRWRERIGQS